MNTITLKDLRDYHQGILDQVRYDLCVRNGLPARKTLRGEPTYVSEKERMMLHDHTRFLAVIDEAISTLSKPC